MKRPEISVIIPVYNGSNYLGSAIESVLHQSFSDFELIIVDDGSDAKHRIGDLVRKYSKTDSRIKFIEKQNGGCASALNVGINGASGKYFSWLSHDDIMLKNRLQICHNFVSEKTDVFCYTDYEIVDAEDSILGVVQVSTKLHPNWTSHQRMPIVKSLVNGCTVFVTVDSLLEMGGFNEKLLTTQDYDMWLKLMGEKNILYINKTTIQSRIHPEQSSYLIKSHTKEADDFYRQLMLDTLKQWQGPLSQLEWLSVFHHHLRLSNYEMSKKFVLENLKQYGGESAIRSITLV